jgi:hypothetical protein
MTKRLAFRDRYLGPPLVESSLYDLLIPLVERIVPVRSSLVIERFLLRGVFSNALDLFARPGDAIHLEGLRIGRVLRQNWTSSLRSHSSRCRAACGLCAPSPMHACAKRRYFSDLAIQEGPSSLATRPCFGCSRPAWQMPEGTGLGLLIIAHDFMVSPACLSRHGSPANVID